MLKDIERKIRRLQQLGKTQITVESPGSYPTKWRTPVADVARYQNDGTEKITPSKFIERAAEEAGDWSDEMSDSLDRYLNGDNGAPIEVADKMATDISRMCDRVDTGRLKSSFRGKVAHGRD